MPQSFWHAQMYIIDDNDAVIRMLVKDRSLNLCRVAITHKVYPDWLFERISWDLVDSFRYVRANEQVADFFTDSSFTSAQWNSWMSV